MSSAIPSGSRPRPIVVLGGNGRLAARLRRHLPADTRYVARGPGEGCIAVGDYLDTPASLFAGARAAINVAGLVRGSVAELTRANVAVPRRLATLARDAGVARFVHVSSFSALGRAAWIEAATPTDPAGDYGASKLAGEAALLALATERFAVVPVRLPAIVGEGAGDKLGQLVRPWARVRALPVPKNDVRRSMIGFDLAARVLAAVATGTERGIVHAADPVPFTYAEAAATIARATGRRVRAMPVPGLSFLRRAAPGLYHSLWADSLLDPAINRAAAMPSDLHAIVAALARGEAR